MGRFGWLYRDPKYDKACTICHEYIEPIVQQAIADAEARDQAEKAGVVDAEKGRDSEEERYTFLRTLAKEHRAVSATEMRNQLLNILVAARDTSACLMSSVLFELSHRPDIQSKVRREISPLGNRAPTYEELKGLTYLNYVIKEVLRLHPPVPINVRVSNKDTTLPYGGGLDGTAPVFIDKGKSIVYSVYSTHRRPDFWGSDAEEFKPERWIDARPGYEFLPFNGGPRICPGKHNHKPRRFLCIIVSLSYRQALLTCLLRSAICSHRDSLHSHSATPSLFQVRSSRRRRILDRVFDFDLLCRTRRQCIAKKMMKI